MSITQINYDLFQGSEVSDPYNHPNIMYDVMPKILSQALLTLREAAVFPRLVNSSYSAQTAERGSVINVPIPSKIKSQSVKPGAYSQEVDPLQLETAQIPLNYWEEAPFALSDRDLVEIMDGVPNIQVQEAARAIANSIDLSLINLYKRVPNYVGVAGTTPFGSDIKVAAQARAELNRHLAPLTDRRVVLDVDADANATSLDAFLNAGAAATDITIRSGLIGEKLGFQFYFDQLMPTHEAGSLAASSGNISTSAAPTTTTLNDNNDPILRSPRKVYQVTLTGTGLTGDVKVGDLFKVAGDKQTYTITSEIEASGNLITISFFPEPSFEWQAGSVVTLVGDHAVNLAFHRDAFGLAMRTEALESERQRQLMGQNGVLSMVMVDPQTGVPLRLEIRPEYKRVRYSIDALWGVGVVRPLTAVRILG